MENDRLAPVLPLRDVVVYPHMAIPLFVGREKSIKALTAAMQDDKRILLVAQKTADTDDPREKDIYPIGTLASILQLLKLPDNTVKVLVEGVQRARITKLSDTGPFLTAELAPVAAEEAAEGARDAVDHESHGEGEGLEPVPEGGRGGARGGAARDVELVEVALDGGAGVVGDGEAQQGTGEPRGRGGCARGAHRTLSDAGSSPCHIRSAACRASRSARAPSASSFT